jgi:hypothetical protein
LSIETKPEKEVTQWSSASWENRGWLYPPSVSAAWECRSSTAPLGRGFLTGRFKRFEDLATDDYRRNSPRFQGENFAKNLELVERVKEMAAGKGISAGQLALAWVLAQGKDIVPIPGTTRRRHLEENIAAADLKITPSDLSDIAASMPPVAASGMRYPEEMMRLVNQ